MHIYNKEKGFSLIEIIVAAGLISFLSLVIATLISDQRSAIVGLEDQLTKIQTIRSIEDILRNTSSCQNSLQGVSIPAALNAKVNLANFKDNLNNVFLSSNTNNNNLRVGQMSLTNISIGAPNSTGTIQLEVPFSRIRPGMGLKEFRTYTTVLTVDVDGAYNITSCSGLSVGVSNFSCSMPGSGNNTCVLGPPSAFKFCYMTGIEAADPGTLSGLSCYVMIDAGNYVIRITGDSTGSGVTCNAQCVGDL